MHTDIASTDKHFSLNFTGSGKYLQRALKELVLCKMTLQVTRAL